MSKLLVVEDDPVDGTDQHVVSGTLESDSTKPYAGTGDYAYGGEVSGDLSDFVTVDGKAVAVVTSTSALRDDAKTDHEAANATSFTPSDPGPAPATLLFVPPTGVGPGKPGEAAGSALLTVGGAKALLDGDPFDTCGITGGKASSEVAATIQTFVTCSQ